MKRELLKFFDLQRSIFGICPCCNQFFRLSDCHVFSGKAPHRSWLDELDATDVRLDRREERIKERVGDERESARAAARIDARNRVRLLDPVFVPRKLDADDAKGVFHPVDFAVFCGLKSRFGDITRVVFLDRESDDESRRRLQRSIETAVTRRRFEWRTVRVSEDGCVSCE